MPAKINLLDENYGVLGSFMEGSSWKVQNWGIKKL